MPLVDGRKFEKSQHFQVFFSGHSVIFGGRSVIVPKVYILFHLKIINTSLLHFAFLKSLNPGPNDMQMIERPSLLAHPT